MKQPGIVVAVIGLVAGAAAPAGAQIAPPQARPVVRTQIVGQVRAARDVHVIHEVRAIGDIRVAAQARSQGRQTFQAEQIDRQTQRLQLGASGLLELVNLAGDISVTAGGGNAVNLEIVRRSRARTEADAKRGLDEVRVNVEHRGERATVRAVYPETDRRQGQRNYSVTVAYTVTAPPGTRVSISTLSGDVTVRDITGDVTAQVTSGDIVITGAGQVSSVRAISGDVTIRDSASDSGISAGTVSGNVVLERVKARRLDIDVTGGDIIARDAAAANAQLKTLSGDVEFSGTLARGGRYELQSHSGDVLLTATSGAGFELQAQTFSGTITMPQSGGELRNVSSGRRSLRATVGDGSAIVTITTFSGDVRIVRK